MSFSTPILVLAFNRPGTTKILFDNIQEIKPSKIYFACDGPRRSKGEEELQKVNEVRALKDTIDWECEVKTLFRTKNLGCGMGVSEAISWFFDEEEMGIILEDDCIPDQSFYAYCNELLEYYKEDSRVTHINGNNFNCTSFIQSDYDYHFGYYPQVWGWASWRRAWKEYRYFLDGDIIPSDPKAYSHLNWNANELYVQTRRWKRAGKEIDTWDYQWHAINQIQGNLAIIPKKNLITNIGDMGTHIGGKEDERINLPTSKIDSPLHKPPYFLIDFRAGKHMMKHMIRYKKRYLLKQKLKELWQARKS